MTRRRGFRTGLEDDEKRIVLEYLRRQGILARKTPAGQVRAGGSYIDLGPEHWPDITGMLPDGTFFVVEMKRAGDAASYHRKRREGQQKFLDQVNRCEGAGILARGADEAIRILGVVIGRAMERRDRRAIRRRIEAKMLQDYDEASALHSRFGKEGPGLVGEVEARERRARLSDPGRPCREMDFPKVDLIPLNDVLFSESDLTPEAES